MMVRTQTHGIVMAGSATGTNSSPRMMYFAGYIEYPSVATENAPKFRDSPKIFSFVIGHAFALAFALPVW